MAEDGDRLRRWLEDAAAEAGFAGVYVTGATLPPETGARLNDFVADGHAIWQRPVDVLNVSDSGRMKTWA